MSENSDILENEIVEIDKELLRLLLLDRTKSKDDERMLYLLKEAMSSFTKYEGNTHSSLQGVFS